MTAVRALFAGPAAARALVDGRDGVVELVPARCAYVRLGPDWLLLGEPSLPFGPLSIAVPGIERLDVRPGLRVRVAGARLLLAGDVVRCERMRERGTPGIASAGAAHVAAIRAAGKAALAALPAPGSRLRDGIDALATARIAEAVASLAGVGEGLTPAGDDVLAGYAAAEFALAGLPTANHGPPAIPAALSTLAVHRSSPLGLAYLRSAERGELPDAAAHVLGAICRGSPEEVRIALPSLSDWGASSGVALGWGMTAAVCHRLGPAEPEAPSR